MKHLVRARAACVMAGLVLAVPPLFADEVGMAVTTAEAEGARQAQQINTQGPIAAWEEMSISSRLSNTPIARVHVRVGDQVQKGQVLVAFENSMLEAELKGAQAALESARLASREADANEERAMALQKSDTLSDQAVLQLMIQAASARAQVDRALAALRRAELRLDYATLRAPDDGVISARSSTSGAVPVSGTELLRLIRQNRYEWRAELTGSQVNRLTSDVRVRINTEGQTITGKLRAISPALDENTRLATAFVDLERSPLLRAGMYVEGRLEFGARDVVLAPSESIVTRGGHDFAVTLNEGAAKLVPVAVGRREGSVTQVLSGISAGTVLIVRGAGLLTDGMRVRPVSVN